LIPLFVVPQDKVRIKESVNNHNNFDTTTASCIRKHS